MGHWSIFSIFFTACIYYSYGCQIEGANWPVPVTASALDTFRGVILDRATTGIDGIALITFGEVLNSGPYVDVSFTDSRLIIETNDAYQYYEEFETSSTMPITITFRCTGGASLISTFIIDVTDTNNNAPRFLPTDNFTFTIAAPVPPGFEITGCLNDLTVRDIDLTTQRIDFAVLDNPNFEIEYDAASSTAVKEFKAILRTTALIRTVPEPIVFTITATDVDLTGDPRLTTRATVSIIGNTDFELPEEPVFSQTFYLGDYTNDNQFVQIQPIITLQSGYDELVRFTTDGEWSNNFETVANGNQVSIRIVTPLPSEVLQEKQILLVVRADREYTSGASVTVVVRLPEGVPLEFERAHYNGTIENNNLQVPTLVLSRGYEDESVSVIVLNEYSSFFTAVVQGNVITLSMTALDEDIINQNSFMNLEIVASTDSSTATAIVTLEIIKDDNVTPVFNRPIYTGSYNPGTGLALQEILLVQGYDESVSVFLEGEYADLFQVTRNGPIVSVYALNIPPEIYAEGQITLSLEATKPRTVGANAVLIITLPAARELEFETSIYRGSFQDNVISLETIRLTTGYDDSVLFSISGDYASYFSVTNIQGQVTINLITPIPNNILSGNNIIILTLAASGQNAITTTTTVLLDIIKDDTTTPVFSRNIYYGTYFDTSNIVIENINLAQGFDDNVIFRIEGDHAEYFDITNTGNNVVLSLRTSIPEEVIYNEKVFLFNVLAEKAFTVGANAVVAIKFPSELTDPVVMRFTENTYTGTIDNNLLTVDNVILTSGYAAGTNFVLTGEYSSYFALTNINNGVSLSLLNTLPTEAIQNTFIVLEIEARRERAVSVWTSVVIEVINQENISPTFTEAYYRGVYNPDSGLQFNEVISLLSGYDETVIFQLDGEFAPLFTLVQMDSNSLSVAAVAPLTDDVLANNSHLLLTVIATKPGAAAARAVISIDIEKEYTDGSNLGFDAAYYTGSYNTIDGLLLETPITLSEGYDNSVQFALQGENSQWFSINTVQNSVTLVVSSAIPNAVLADNSHLVFALTAQRPGAIPANATIVISLISDESTDGSNLGFDRVTYLGSIQNDQVDLGAITIIDGYTDDVTIGLYGDLASYFTTTRVGPVVNVVLQAPIPTQLIPNRVVILEIRVSAPQSATAFATIVFEVFNDATSAVQLVFDAAYYTGSYNTIDGLLLETPITLSEGYDNSVQFALQGENSQWFSINTVQNSVTLVVSSAIPNAVLADNSHLVFALTAQKPGAIPANATIVISLISDESTDGSNLGFDRVTYLGSIQNDQVDLGAITIIDGYTDDVTIGLYGDLASYFTTTRVGPVINVVLQAPIPTQLIPNRVVILEIRVSAPQSATAFATIVFKVLNDASSAVQLVFDAAYYTGSYNTIDGLLLETPITLSEGYDNSVQFALQGENSQWFSINTVQNSVTLVVSSAIPNAVLADNSHLVFALTAQRPGAIPANATIVISLISDESTDGSNLGFDRVTYLGSIQNDQVDLGAITIIDGYTDDVTIGLYGDLASYFTTTRVGPVVNVVLQAPIPTQLIPNRVVILEIRVSAPQSATAFATIVFEVLNDATSAVQLVFDAAYYTGSYNTIDGLLLEIPITLSEGYDNSVQFALQGENSQWFSINTVQNSVTLVVSSAIPNAVLADNSHLVFALTAQRPGAIPANATIVISLISDESTDGSNLGFDRVTYLGSIQNDQVDLGAITIIDGYTDDVTIGLYGDLASYFTTTRVGPVVNVVLQAPIPTQLIPNRVVILEIRVSAPQSATAFATIVFEVLNDATSAVQLVFDAAYYTGSYNTIDGLLLETPITLSEGYDNSVQFALQGENSQWFSINTVQNSVTLVVSSAIPNAVLADNSHLVFALTAQRPGAIPANATIVISLISDESTDGSNLGFDRVTYLGSIQNDQVDLGAITIIDGYTDDVTIGLYGDLASYFTTTRVGPVVNVVLQAPIPTQLIPNRVVILEIRVSAPQSATAFATIVFEVVNDATSAVQLVFDAAYYTGSYNTIDGLLLETPITLSEGYDNSVQFALQGENSQWFSINTVQNSVTLVVSSAIPNAVLADNSHLVFALTAQRPGAIPANATIVISLISDESTDGSNLGFDRVTYLGSIQNDQVDLGAITIIDGYTDDVTIGLYGDLASYFTTTRVGPVINVVLQAPIPTQLIPNRVIILEIRVSAPQSATAFATIVFEVLNDATSAVQLVFDAAYYTGSYNTIDGLLLETPITLSEGYDNSVQFALQGENSQWFSINTVQNSVTLVVSSAIPNAVLADNSHLVFALTAQRPGAIPANATIVISLISDESTDGSNLGFDRVTYLGSIQNDQVDLGAITIIDGYTDDVTIGLYGDLASYFTTTRVGPVVNVVLQAPIPTQLIPNRVVILEIRVSAPQSATAFATIVFEVLNDATSAVQLVFDAAYYTGSYNTIDGLLLETPITLSEGYDNSVQFALQGENSQWFSINTVQNSVTLVVSSAIPNAVLADNSHLVFALTAQRPGAIPANATIVISLISDESTDGSNLGFDRVTYLGSIQNDQVDLGAITIIDGYTDDVTIGLYGDLASYFTTTRVGPVVNVVLQAPIPTQLIPNRVVILEIRVSAPQSATAFATIVFEVLNDATSAVQLVFDAAYYTGSYNTIDGLLLETPITLSEGYDNSVQFALQGENSQWFSINTVQNSVTLVVSSAIPNAVLADNSHLVFALTAQRPGAIPANATIVISLISDESTDGSNLGFDRVTYLGSIQNDQVDLGAITIIDGYTDDVTIGLYGDLASYFTTTRVGPVVNVVLQAPIPTQLIPNRVVILEIRVSAPQSATAFATIVFEVLNDATSAVQLVFDAAYYTGSYNTIDGLLLETPITLSEGYDNSVQFALQGENSQWFSINTVQNSVTLVVSSAIPNAVLADNSHLVFALTAQRPGAIPANATIVISLTDDYQTGDDVSFERVLYEGIIQRNEIQHEVIVISGYDGTNVDLFGDYSSLFVAYVTDGQVLIQASGSVTLPADVTRLALELHAAGARAVLLLNVVQSDAPVLPSVSFSSDSYVLTVQVVQTGLVGRVSATADNGEAVSYSLALDNAHLQTRLSINNVGELYLSAPANSGVYTFQVIATTVITQATGTATVYLTAEAVTVCGDNDIVVPPLIVLDRDEEEAHRNLVVLNSTQNGCYFSLTNRWPTDQNWLYVDENGLHTTAIDREHQSIAFMALSQVQVELILHCQNDNAIRAKRSERTDWLGPYDYGTNKWILTDSIPYNSRRSLVNLIVNDINDNAPIFVGKEHEPLVVGYPIDELEERILPRSLAELKATDADIGENAALLYWSSESALAVAPTTGFVHVRTGARLQPDQLLTVSATDRYGEGLTGTIQLLVKLLDLNNIAVVTVRDAFLDNEIAVLANLSDAVGYEVKTLRSVVISDDIDEDVTRKKRETGTVGASLQLYVYGLIEREPVAVDRLILDINSNAAAVSVISTLALEDHLEVGQINVLERDVGLLAATIVLSILLFILILLIAIWFFLRWRKNRNYDEFSDKNSLASRNESLGDLPKPEDLRPKFNIEDLKRSEKRLQEMLNAPIEEVTIEPMTSRKETPFESILDFPMPEVNAPIVIQSIDKLKDAEESEDEFGETNARRRKSVVTFNENVEKIIHVEDDTDSNSQSGYEIYKL